MRKEGIILKHQPYPPFLWRHKDPLATDDTVLDLDAAFILDIQTGN